MSSVKKPRLKAEAPPRSSVGGVLPEVVDYQNRRWTVVEGEPGIDYRNMVVSVPSGEERRAERLRVLTKVRVSPETPEWASKIASGKNIDAMEEVRARKIVSSTFGLDEEYQSGPEADEQIRHAIRKGDQQEAARLALVRGFNGRVTADDAYSDLIRQASADGKDELAGDLVSEGVEFQRYVVAAERLIDNADYRTSVAAARMVDELDTLRKPGRRGKPGSGGGDQPESYEDLIESSNEGGNTGRMTRDANDLAEKAKRDFNEALREAGGFGSDGDGDVSVGDGTPFDVDSDDVELDDEEAEWDECHWGSVLWVKPPLMRNMTLRRTQRKKRPTDEGAVVRNMHRWYTDRRIFDRKKKVPGGTLLMDMSGSMSLSAEQVEAIIEISPMATIVTYSGASGRGKMRLIAKAGRRADDESIYETQGGNEIDGPALKWLAKQAEPRVWISDGLACTAGGDSYRCIAWCKRFAKRNRIVRMPNADEAVALLRRLW